MEYKCLSVKNPWAWFIVNGHKTVEIRPIRTNFTGDIIIISSIKPDLSCKLLNGYALGIVTVVDCVKFTKNMESMAKIEHRPKHWAWVLENPRLIKPIQIKGQLGIFTRCIQNLQLI